MNESLYRLSCTAGCLLLLAATLATLPASAQTACDETVRAQFQSDVEAGATQSDLEATYAACRQNLETPTCTATTTSAATDFGVGLVERLKKVTNNGSIYYERMNGCGYHPQAETVACDVEVRRRFGYGGFPSGSNEHVLFCLDCNRDGIWDYATLGSVHVTDDVSGGPLSFYFNVSATTWAAPTFANCTVNNGTAIDVKAILSWVLRPNPVTTASCSNFNPFWGNTIFFTSRNDP